MCGDPCYLPARQTDVLSRSGDQTSPPFEFALSPPFPFEAGGRARAWIGVSSSWMVKWKEVLWIGGGGGGGDVIIYVEQKSGFITRIRGEPAAPDSVPRVARESRVSRRTRLQCMFVCCVSLAFTPVMPLYPMIYSSSAAKIPCSRRAGK